MCAFDNVSRLDSRNTFSDMQTEKVQAGATTLLRQQNTVDGVVQGICARASQERREVSRHRLGIPFGALPTLVSLVLS